ncbi:tetratricopeptide repeat protein [Marimonas lutisalis]|uniref:tetratricopeptide repeat protein n=1 Tax=Marimonas lutisalis TaxID=2545756 RepID=UPI001375657E|nr:tetratricopeptide repeat protein [Marimonas lutisalis]
MVTIEDSPQDLKIAAINKHHEGDLDSARNLYCRALIYTPDDAEIWTNLGAIYRQHHVFEAALRAQRRARALKGDSDAIANNLANSLDDVGQHLEAVELRRHLVSAHPHEARHLALLSRSLHNSGRPEEAKALLSEAIDQDGAAPEIRLEYGILNLTIGDYETGFFHYLARREAGLTKLPDIDVPRWTGQSLEGRTILVLFEQGLGDTICFARFIPYLKELGASVHLIVRKPLLRVLQHVLGADAVITKLCKGTHYDFWTSLLDIPVDYFHFRSEIPHPAKLALPKDSISRAAAIAAPHRQRFRVGCTWHGAPGFDRNPQRSVPHEFFASLADVADVQLFSLYKGEALGAYFEDGTASVMLDAASDDRDIADCAATINEMDLVITIDTLTAHLAGSMGKTVWNILHWEPFWLYGKSGEWTPWYPSMTLFRQETPFCWEAVFNDLRDRLTAAVARWRNGDCP